MISSILWFHRKGNPTTGQEKALESYNWLLFKSIIIYKYASVINIPARKQWLNHVCIHSINCWINGLLKKSSYKLYDSLVLAKDPTVALSESSKGILNNLT